MNEKNAYTASVIFSALALVLLVVNISLANVNRAEQLDISQRQSTIANGQALGQLNQGLVQAMADAAYKNNNTQLRDLLGSQGISVKSEPTPPAAEKSKDKK